MIGRRLRLLLRGPLPALPRGLDALSERWAGLGPRARALLAVLAVVLAVGLSEVRVLAAESRWGGAGVEVLVATTSLSPGADPEVRTVAFPPPLVPPRAVTQASAGEVLALPLPEGAVLTEDHLDPAGPAAGLDEDLRVVPFPVEDGWGVAAGGWVDVWVLDEGAQPAAQVARSRPVLELHADEVGRATALIGVGVDEVADVTAGLARGNVLLAHAPPR